MRIAIFGATSQIAKDLVLAFTLKSKHRLVLYARRPEAVRRWLCAIKQPDRYPAHDFAMFDIAEKFDAIINFVGVGDPARGLAAGADIFDATSQHDSLALNYQKKNPNCRYIFLSSGAAYGSTFEEPVNSDTKACFAINDLQSTDWYAVAKLHAECRHRSQPSLPIVDIRIFNYFSHTQDISARFLISDILRAIKTNTTLQTSSNNIFRDYIHPTDLYQLITLLLDAPEANMAVDCYSLAAIDINGLLPTMQERFGLKYETAKLPVLINATGFKKNYYSLNTRAADFGYKPSYTSLAGLILEFEKALAQPDFWQ